MTLGYHRALVCWHQRGKARVWPPRDSGNGVGNRQVTCFAIALSADFSCTVG